MCYGQRLDGQATSFESCLPSSPGHHLDIADLDIGMCFQDFSSVEQRKLPTFFAGLKPVSWVTLLLRINMGVKERY